MPAPDPYAFGAMLRQRRQARRLSLRELAAAAHISKSQIANYEHGRKPHPADAWRLDVALEARGELAALTDDARRPLTVTRREIVGATAGLAVHAVTLPHDRRLGRTDVERVLAHTARLRRLDDFVGGGDTYATFVAACESTAAALRRGGHTDSVRRALLAVLGEQAQLAGWAAFDAGWHAHAERLYRDSLTAAEYAGDAGLAGNALCFLAYQASALGGSGVELATASCDTAREGAPPRVRALLHERRAWAYAVAGDRSGAEGALADAEETLAEPREPEPDWVYWLDEIEIQIMTGRCWTVLRRPLRAITALDAALARYDATHGRDMALYLSYLADAYLDAGEPEQAAHTTIRAIDLSAGVASIRPGLRVDRLMSRLGPHRGLSPVREVFSRRAELTRQRASSAAPIPDMPAMRLPPAPR